MPFLILVISFSTSVQAADSFYLHLRPHLLYRDARTECSTAAAPAKLLFDATIKSGKITRASLKEITPAVIKASLNLDRDEMAGIVFETSGGGFIDLKSIAASDRLVRWLFFNSGAPTAPCRPSAMVHTVGPVPASFIFEKGGTQTRSFTGVLRDGTAYDARLSLTQELRDWKGN